MSTRREILRSIAAPLETLYGEREARQIALTAVSELTGISPASLVADPGAPLDFPGIDGVTAELAAGRPLQYVLGSAEFCDLRIGVSEGVLVPRPETEELVRWVCDENPGARRVLDIGTGSGCIALALKHRLPAAEVCAADISESAIAIARENARTLGLGVVFRHADALKTTTHPESCEADPAFVSNHPESSPDALSTPKRPVPARNTPTPAPDNSAQPHPAPDVSARNAPVSAPDTSAQSASVPDAPALADVFPGPFDVVVSNPPYIPQHERAAMHRNVTDYEPHEALFVPDGDPLLFYRAIARTAHGLLHTDGTLYFEIHERFGDAVCALLRSEGFRDVELRRDFCDKPRMVRARKI